MPGANTKRVCLVGRLKPQKDYRLALRVVRRLVDNDASWQVVFVGEARPYECLEYAEQVVADRDSLGLQDFVEFVGNRLDVPEIVASCDALLVTSANEGFPNVVLEAMACGTPVVSTDYSDVRRILPMAWQVVPSRDESELAAAVQRCHADRDAVCAAQRRWVETHATIDISASNLISIYEKYLDCPIVEGRRAT
jgi:glycosyltransferase involved in cell wall biosynthesis